MQKIFIGFNKSVIFDHVFDSKVLRSFLIVTGLNGDRPFTRPTFYQKSYNMDLLRDSTNKFD